MKIELKEIERINYEECISLKVDETQKHFVAPNINSLVEAHYEPDLYPLAIYDNDIMIGFILYDFDKDINGWSMSRFMIDSKFQNKGYGKQALEIFLSYFKAKYGNIPLFTSASIDNPAAIHLYLSYGFIEEEKFQYENNGVTYNEVRMKLFT